MKSLDEYLELAALAHGHICAGQVLGATGPETKPPNSRHTQPKPVFVNLRDGNVEHSAASRD